MDKPEVTILQALENKEVFVSVRKNRLYNKDDSPKAAFKLVLAITAQRPEGNKIVAKIKSNIAPEDVLLDAHQHEGISHLLVYCKDAQIVAAVADSFNGHTLRSNTRYELISKEELNMKAHSFENTLIA